jgi:hypothetical protein
MLVRQDQSGQLQDASMPLLPKGRRTVSTLPSYVSQDRSLLRRTYLYSDGIPLQLQSAGRVL